MDEEAPPSWFTEAQRGDWQIGDEVIVTLGECKIGIHHGTEEIGKRGTIIAVTADLAGRAPGHNYLVYFRHQLDGSWGNGQGRTSWCYTAGELRRFTALDYAREATSLQSRPGLDR